jgi:formate hydrogenlyase transcriptional activator
MEGDRLLSLAVDVAAGRNLPGMLQTIVQGLASHPGVALARIWLHLPGDICQSCFLRAECRDRTQCFHLVASSGTPVSSPEENWSFLQGYFRRIPMNVFKVGQVGSTGTAMLIKDVVAEGEHIARPEWVQREGIRSFAGHPFIFGDKVLGVLATFTREPLDERAFGWLGVFANQAAVAIANARAFAELAAVNEELRKDVLERTRAEERIRQDERELRVLVDFVPQVICEVNPDGTLRYMNRTGLEYFGRTLDELTQSGDPRVMIYHPDDLGIVRNEEERALAMGTACELEARMRRHDGVYRWFSIRYEPRRDGQGRIVRWYGTGVDIEERKQGEQRTRAENVVLREAVDKASTFEEIVGVSARLGAVLSHVAKVAPTDSTVLITGETGSGKELVARAIHKRSHRASRVFVSVNCAAIPPSLIASELFGHEKGAFTGAMQRRVGRFELAEGGTIFLDEVGELPPETQVALLRVLQEREFERVGGGHPIRVDVRVIAATNRDLEGAMADGVLRADLFYRLNVFPIHMPALRDRRDDIPLLVRYFVDRYARAAGKKITRVSKKSFDLLQSYSWPGNIRELQNVIERSVIVSETDTLTVDEGWFLSTPVAVKETGRPLAEQLTIQERTTIESALAETRGRVSGPAGAAAKLRIPPSTLESRIKALRIDKNRFKAAY